ncbi:cellulase family glycosylhydrolase [Patescibacteria group bacterium]|nr:cellulase family glycosylhydrolase [Patescibacteria group bacterium]
MFKNARRIKRIFFILIIFLFLIFLLSRGHIYGNNELEYGITFSKKQAESLGLDWRKVYLAALDELGVKKIRLPAYWDEVEKNGNEYFWDDLDWQIAEAEERGAEIILAVGGRLPRWPECHFPGWAKGLTKEEREAKILSYIEKVVSRYKENKSIAAWQVENEPFLAHFGDCPEVDGEFLDKEIALTRSLDVRPIVVTDSGELSVWIPAARRADIFGTTMYRDTYSRHLKMYIHYPIAPGFFRFKKNITRLFTPNLWDDCPAILNLTPLRQLFCPKDAGFAKPDKWVVIELQAEPWGPVPYQNLSKEERDRTMNLEKFREIIEFARLSGFKEFYLWGVEWWYWERAEGRPEMWEEAKVLF